MYSHSMLTQAVSLILSLSPIIKIEIRSIRRIHMQNPYSADNAKLKIHKVQAFAVNVVLGCK